VASRQASARKAEHLIIVLPGLLAERSFVENVFSRSNASWFYLVTTGTVQTEAGKPPPRPLVVAIGYSLAYFDVLVGWGGDWVMFRGADILSRRETIMVELRNLMSKEVLRLKEEEWRKVKSSLEEAAEWEFGVELSPTEGIWTQRFPKGKPEIVTTIEQTSIWLMKTGQSTTNTSTTLSTQELPSPGSLLNSDRLRLLTACILMLIIAATLVSYRYYKRSGPA